MKSKTLISALPLLYSTKVIEVSTGEIVETRDLNKSLDSLVSYVRDETERLYFSDKLNIENICKSYTKINPAEHARQQGIRISKLHKNILAKSRVEKLVQFKLISEVSSYVLNTNTLKQAPSFTKSINLGAVDKQLAKVSYDANILTLQFKCWDREFLVEFTIPDYVLERNIVKFSLPVIKETDRGYGFIFNLFEKPEDRSQGIHNAGVDLGRIEPYVAVVTNNQGQRVAHYYASKRLKQLNNKRERLLAEAKFIYAKEKQYQALGLEITILKKERKLIKAKASRLAKTIAKQIGHELTKQLKKHKVDLVYLEDLRWVQGSKYGSKWSHGIAQDHIEHSLKRKGIRTKKVSPRNSSQLCYKCGSTITVVQRNVKCSGCNLAVDRDYNAGHNMSTLKHLNKSFPTFKRKNGSNCSSLISGKQVTNVSLSSVAKKTLLNTSNTT